MQNRFFLVCCAALLVASSAHAAVTVQNYYRLGDADPGAVPGGAATNTLDSAGAKHLSVGAGPVYATNVSAEAAQAGSALSMNLFSGSYASGVLLSNVTDNFGLEAWVKPTTVSGNHTVAYNGNGGNNGWGLVQVGNTFQALFGGVAGFGSGPATNNTWTHVALVRSAGTATLYVNGVASGTNASAPNAPGGGFAIGQSFSGLMDEVRFFTFAPGQFSTNDLLRLAPDVAVQQPAGTHLTDGGSRYFGSVNVGASASLTFTVTNTGAGDLSGLSITMDGTNAAQFSVTASPSATVAPGGSTTFTVRFLPTSLGFKTAALHLISNDPDESSFDINLHGSGAALTVQNYFRLGENDPGAVPGPASTTRDSVSTNQLITSAGSPFYANSVSAEAAARAGSTLCLTIFNTTYASGTALSNVTDNFGLEAWFKTATTSGNHCLAYNGNSGGNGWGIFQVGSTVQGLFGGVTFFGSAAVTLNTWTHVAIVRSAGTATLYVNGVASGTTAATPIAPAGQFGLGAAPPGMSGEYMDGSLDEVRFFTLAAGLFSTNDLLRLAPEIAVQQPAGSNLADGGSRDFGNVSLAANASLTFTVTNRGLSALTGLGLSLDSATPAEFSVTASPAATVAAGSSTTFTVRFAPTRLGVKTATLRLASNDGDENPFDINLQGTGFISSNAQLAGLTVSSGPLVPDFAAASTNYTAGASLDTTNLTVTPISAEPNATLRVRFNGGAFVSIVSGSPSEPLALDLGANTVEVRVISHDGTVTNFYTVTITRALPTVEHYYPIGEIDPGATNNSVISSLQDALGGPALTATGAPVYSADVSAGAAARAGSLLSMNLSTGGPYASGAIISTVTDNFGLEVWVKPTTLTGNHTLVYNGNPGSSGWGIGQVGNIYQVLFGGVEFFGNGPVTLNTWTHVALVRSAGTTTLYVNGVASVDTSPATPNVPVGSFALGVTPPALNSDFVSGFLDEVRFFTFAPGQFSTNFLLRGGGAAYSVNSLGDTGAGSGNAGDLRYCLTRANTNPVSTILLNVSGTITLQSPLPIISEGLTIDGRAAPNTIISGSNQHRVFFVDAPARTVNFRQLNIANGRAKGGDGGPSGGGGLGAGGAIFVNSGLVTLSSVSFSNNTAQGGQGGDGGSRSGGGGGGLGGRGGNGSIQFAGGGGGYFGNGGDGVTSPVDGAGGGGGIFGNGASGGGFYGGGGGGATNAGTAPTPGPGGGAGGNAYWQTVLDHTEANGGGGDFGGGGGGAGRWDDYASPPTGGNGGTYGGGGGGSVDNGGLGGRGGAGGDFGGGGGSVGRGSSGGAGAGGYGGGGGGADRHDSRGTTRGGDGGFGGGSGGAALNAGGAGIYAGRGGDYQASVVGYWPTSAGGGGGASLGGAIFVRSGHGASLEFINGSETASATVAGVAGITPAGDVHFIPRPAADGQSLGSAFFLPAGDTIFRGGTVVNGLAGFTGAALRKITADTLTLAGTNFYNGGTSLERGVLAISNNSALGSGVLSMNGGTLRSLAGLALNNAITLGATGNFFDTRSGPLALTGIIRSNGALQKMGTNTLILTAANTYTGGTTVSNGALLASNLTGSATGPGLVTVSSNGLLGGSGTISGATTLAGSLAPGHGGPALLTFSSSLTAGGTATLLMELAGTNRGAASGYDAVNVGGALTFGGKLKVVLTAGFTPARGDTFNLFDWGSTAGTFATLDLPALPSPLAWNTGALSTAGSLTVYDPVNNDPPTLAAISGVTTNEDAGVQVVNFTGINAGLFENQTLTVTATSSNPALIPNPTVNYTSPNATGSLSFTPVANMSGTAIITVTVTDDATAGGAALATNQTFTVIINSVNDAPSFIKGGNQSVTAQRSGLAQIVPAWATAIDDGDAQVAQTLTFINTNSNPGLFAVAPFVAVNGTLSYTPSGLAGSATVGVSLTDDATAGGPALTTAVQTFTITVTPVFPEVSIEQPSGTNLADGASRDFGSVNLGTNTTLTFTVRNSGAGDLLLSGTPRVAISGAHAADFTVIAQPASPVLGGGDAVVLDNGGFATPVLNTGDWSYGTGGSGWSLAGGAGLAHNGSVWFVNPAPEGEQAAFIQNLGTITRTVSFPGPGSYVIRFALVRRSAAEPVNDLEVRMDGALLGTVLNSVQTNDVWRSFTVPFQCPNAGNHTLVFAGLRTPGSSAIDDVQIGGATTFQVRFTPAASGLRTATLSITNNDADENPYDLALTGTGVDLTPPPPVIRTPSLTVLGNGAFQLNFANTNNATFSVLAATNIALPASNWTVLGPATNLGGGLYQFTDPTATNYPGRFYRLRFP